MDKSFWKKLGKLALNLAVALGTALAMVLLPTCCQAREEPGDEPQMEPAKLPTKADPEEGDASGVREAEEAPAETGETQFKDAPNEAATAELQAAPDPTPPAPPQTIELGDPPWLEAAAATHVGLVRPANEDRFFLGPWGSQEAAVAGVFDGMGGHGGGDLAAQIACQSVFHLLQGTALPDGDPARYEVLLRGLYEGDGAIRWRGKMELGRDNMGTTAVLTLLTPDGGLHLHCGDSRLYHYRGGELLFKTRDQTVVQMLVDNGQLLPEEAASHPLRARLTSCLGGGTSPGSMVVEPAWNREGAEQPARLTLQPGDLVLLCSDGLSGEVPPEALDHLVQAHGRHPATLVRECIQAALASGGHDNVTVVAMRWLGEADQGEPVDPPATKEVDQG